MNRETLAVIGGTGKEGGGLALRFAHAGFSVIVGSRDSAKAQAAAREINSQLGRDATKGSENAAAVEQADIIFLTVPYAAQLATVVPLQSGLVGKILVDATVPLMPPNVARVQLPDAGSAVAVLQQKLGESVRVVSAFQNVSAHQLKDLSHRVDCDVIVCGDDADACDTVIDLAKTIGVRAFYGGAICNSVAAEALTSVLIAINRRYKVPASGLRITGIEVKT
jgi:NADPH-dependent F420 reductase